MANILALTSGDWNTGSNWDGGIVPGVGDVAVMNGKTMTLPNGGVITCDKITSDSTLGLANGSVSLLIPTAGTYTFTINADLERIGAVSTSLVAFSTTSFTDKHVTLNINGDVTSRGTTVQDAVVLLNASSSSAPNSITLNMVGDAVAGGSMANSPALSVSATYGNLDINITGNVLYEGAAANYAVHCNNSQGYGRVTVSGYVMCSGSASNGNVNISGSVVDDSYVTVGAGIVPGGTGIGVSIARSTGTVINAAPDGVAIRPGVGSAGLSVGIEQASVTVNGDVMAGTSTSGLGIKSGTNNTNLRQVTVNGDLRSDTGIAGTNGSVRIVSVSGRFRLVVNGDIDASSTDINSGSAYPVTLTSIFGANSGLVVNGDIISPAAGTTDAQSAVSITATSVPGMEELTVTGTVYGSANGIGILTTPTAIIQNASIGGVASNTMSPINAAYPAVEGLVPVNAFDIINRYDYGVTGVAPLKNCGRVRFADTVVFDYNGEDNTPRTASLANSAAIIPAVADVRDGVAVGDSTGTLVVPPAANVLDGITYDNGTVGTLVVSATSEPVDLSAVTSSLDNISAILSGSDHMGYTLDPQWSNVKIHVDVDEGGSVISSRGKIGADFLGVVTDDTKKFRGRSSLLFNSSSSIKVMSSNIPLFTSGASPFTLEMYVNPAEYPATSTLKMLFSLPNNINLELKSNETLGLWVSANTASPVYVSSTATLPLNTWSHIALTRNGDNFKVYLDGIEIISLNRPSTSYPTTGLDVWIGAASFNASYGFVGNIRDITFTDNVERYTTNFTVPAVCYPYTQYSTVAGDRTLAGRINEVKVKTDQLTFTDGKVNANSESVPLVTVATAITDGFWSSTSTWNTGVIPDASTFVYTNGYAITVSDTVNCAGYADTPNGGDGVVVDEDGNAVLVNSFGDPLFSDVTVMASFEGNLDNLGTATLSANAYAMGYGTAPVALFGRTQFARKSAFDDPIQAGVVFPMPVVDNSVGLTVEFWWYPLANNNGTFFASSYLGLIPTYGNMMFFTNGSSTQIGGSQVSLAGLAPATGQWNHCVVQRTKAGAVEVYVNGVRVMNQTGSPAIAAGNWLLFAAQPDYYSGLRGYLSELRVTVSASGTRYNGNFAVPTAPFINYAPPPGTSLTGRLVLQNNGAVVQSTVAPTVSVAGILSSLSRFTRAYIGQVGNDTGAIKSKTDQLAFTSHGVVADTVDPNVVTDISVAVTDGNWDAQSTWEDGNIPLITSFVFTNGNEVIVNGTVECAGVADTSEAGGLIVDAGGNVALKSAYGDELYSSVYYLANLDGNINNLSYGAGSATFGSGAVPTYSTAQTMGVSQSLVYGGNTSASVNVSMPALASGKEITIEYWVKHNANVGYFYFGYVDGSSSSFLRASKSISFSRVVQPSEYSSGITAPIILNQWYHIALVRKSDNTWSWYENGNRLAVVAGLSSIPTKVWGLFTDNPINGSGRHVNGWVTHPRITLGVARYTGVTYAIPYAPFPQYAPAPGSTISGRVVLGTNGAVIQAGNNPNSVRTGILQSIAAKLMYGNDAILNSIGSVVAPDNTARFDALDNVASGIKAQTDLLTFTAGGVVADIGNADAITGIATAVNSANWNLASTWNTGTIPDATTFVYTNGKAVTVDGTVHCAGLADTTQAGGLILDMGGNASLISSYGDSYFNNVVTMFELDGDNVSSGSDPIIAITGGSFVPDTIGGNASVWSSTLANYNQNYISYIMPEVSNSESYTMEVMWKTGATLAESPRLTSISSVGSNFVELSPNSSKPKLQSSNGANGNPFGSFISTSMNYSNLSYTDWNHIVLQRIGTTVSLYINGVLTQTYTVSSGYSVSAASTWKLYCTTNGRLAHVRTTKNATRYSGASFLVPSLPYPAYAPAPGSTLSGRAILGTNGAVIQHAASPSLATAGVLSSMRSSMLSKADAIKAKTDLLTFTAGGVVADAGTTGGSAVDLSPVTSAISTVDGKVTLIKTKTDQLSFSSGKVIADASAVDYTPQLNAITSTVNAISDAVDIIDAVTSKIAFETVYSEGDPNLAQVIFKAEFNGTNGSTVINADTGQTGTNQGSPSLNTAYARTGVSSVALSSSIVSYGNISSLNLGSNDFTIEFSVNFSSIVSSAGDYAGIVGKRASSGDFSWICYVTEGKMNFLTSGTNAISTAHPTVLSPGTWYDVAISRTGDILKFYVNGVLSQGSCTGLNIATTTAPFFIGRLSYDISSYHMFGYLDRLRVTVGTGRYASVTPVSPPVSEYPTTLNGVAQSYKVIANCDSQTTIPTDLTDRLTDLRNRINAIHFIVKDE